MLLDIVSNELSPLAINHKHEAARWDFIKNHIAFAGKSVADVGANTGYFSLAAIESGAARVNAYEGNAAHCSFLHTATGLLGLDDQLKAHPHYIDFGNAGLPEPVDIIFLLNVLHHYGDDYGNDATQPDEIKKHISRALNLATQQSGTIVFQLGFNIQGNRMRPLFEHGTKGEVIAFMEGALPAHWRISALGIAERTTENAIRYAPPSQTNLLRDNALGEFLNRPLFILEARR
jgi:SAM-dependent methyltransferase